MPQIVIIIDLERERLRIVDNGGGLNPQQMIDWAECGNSTNRSRVTEMLEADANDPRVVGLFSQLFSSYGIGGKGGAGALTRAGKEIHGNLTLFSCQGVDEDGVKNLQKINFDHKEAQRRQVAPCPHPRPPYCCGRVHVATSPRLNALATPTHLPPLPRALTACPLGRGPRTTRRGTATTLRAWSSQTSRGCRAS